jgi:hypothetical protein
MTLPNVLGIGAPRCGTTWLDLQLRAHPDAFVPVARKEIDYFNLYYDKGLEWYERHYAMADLTAHRVVGDISPRYFSGDHVPERIRETLGSPRFLVILRDPVARMISDYTFASGRSTRPIDFARMSSTGWSYRCGFYADHLNRYFRILGRDSFLILIFEELFADVDGHLDKLADFLDVSRDGFASEASRQKINSSMASSNPIVTIARYGGRWLRRNDLDGVANLGLKALSLLPMGPPKIPTITTQQLRELRARYERSVSETEELLGRELPQWREAGGAQVA